MSSLYVELPSEAWTSMYRCTSLCPITCLYVPIAVAIPSLGTSSVYSWPQSEYGSCVQPCIYHVVLYYLSSYGDTLLLVGCQELRERALFPVDKAPTFEISDIQYCLLEVVGRARHCGILRTTLTNKYLKIDARSTFHHVKTLKKAGLLSVKVCYVYNTFSNVLFISGPKSDSLT